MDKYNISCLAGRQLNTPVSGYARRTFHYIFWCVLLAALLSFLGGCKEKVKPGSVELKRQTVAGLEVNEIIPSQVDEYYEASGTVKAKTLSVVSSRVMGTVTSLRVREGDRVQDGHVLLTLDDRDVAQKVIAAEKAVEAADQNRSLTDVTYKRFRKLFEGKAISQQEMDQIETQRKVAESEYERAKAGLAEAEVYFGFTKITSPVSGVVTEKKIDQGSMAVPGMPLLTVEDTSSFRIEVNVDESLSGKLKAGMPVDVIIDSLSLRAGGRISEIVPSVDPLSRTFPVKVLPEAPGLKSGLYAKVRIPVGKKEAILLPRSAIIERGQLTGVYAVDDRRVLTYRLVRAGREYDGNVEILSGINPGDKVVTAGAERAVDGGLIQ
jgi:RND family efflux transporter MFP subunit